MGSSKVIVDFSTTKYTDARLSNKTNYIIGKMDGNPHFVDVQPLLIALHAANIAYSASLAKAQDGSKEDTARKIQLRTALIVVLKKVAADVQTVSMGDEVIILSSGFDASKKHSTVGELNKPTEVVVKQGSNKGSIIITCNLITGARFYQYEYTGSPVTANSHWIIKTSTRRRVTIDGLTSGKEYTFRVAGGGSHLSRIWSNEISTFVL